MDGFNFRNTYNLTEIWFDFSLRKTMGITIWILEFFDNILKPSGVTCSGRRVMETIMLCCALETKAMP